VDVHAVDAAPCALDGQCGGGVDDPVVAAHHLPDADGVADVAALGANMADQVGCVERRGVEQRHLAAVTQRPSREVDAEEARAAGNEDLFTQNALPGQRS
jgi:hypothetical protein